MIIVDLPKIWPPSIYKISPKRHKRSFGRHWRRLTIVSWGLVYVHCIHLSILLSSTRYQVAVQKKVVTEAIKKAAADLYLLRGSIYIYDGKMQKAFDDFDACVTLVPSMIEQVKKFQVYHLAASYSNLLFLQDNITIKTERRFIVIDRNEMVKLAILCGGLYLAIVLLSG